MSRRNRTIKVAAWVLGLALLGLPAGSAAEEQVGIVLVKDADAKTLTLEGGRVLHVSPRTVITGLSGERITFAELPEAQRHDGLFAVSGDEGILYEVTAAGRRLNASRIQLLGTIPD